MERFELECKGASVCFSRWPTGATLSTQQSICNEKASPVANNNWKREGGSEGCWGKQASHSVSCEWGILLVTFAREFHLLNRKTKKKEVD